LNGVIELLRFNRDLEKERKGRKEEGEGERRRERKDGGGEEERGGRGRRETYVDINIVSF